MCHWGNNMNINSFSKWCRIGCCRWFVVLLKPLWWRNEQLQMYFFFRIQQQRIDVVCRCWLKTVFGSFQVQDESHFYLFKGLAQTETWRKQNRFSQLQAVSLALTTSTLHLFFCVVRLFEGGAFAIIEGKRFRSTLKRRESPSRTSTNAFVLAEVNL